MAGSTRVGGKLRIFNQAALLIVLFFSAVQIGWPAAAAAEANVRVEVTPNKGTVDDEFELRIILDGTKLDGYGDPHIEEDDRFSVEAGGVMRHQVYLNGKGSENKVFTFIISPVNNLKPGRYRVPAISFSAGGKQYDVNEPDIEILPGGNESSAAGVKDRLSETGSIDFSQSVNEERPYVGQQILYKTEMLSTKPIQAGVVSDIPFDGFWHEPLGKAKEDLRQVNQVLVRTYESAEALFPNRAGEITIPPRLLTAELQVGTGRRGRDPFDAMRYGGLPDPLDLLQAARTVKKKFTTQPVKVTALPVPPIPPGMPHPAYIPVGQMALVALTDLFDAKVGDSISYSIDLTGDANLRPIELPNPEGKDLDKFKIYPDQPDLKSFPSADKISFKKRFPVSLIPRSAGTFELPSYSFIVFEPTRGQFKTLTTPRRTINVAAGDPGQGAVVLPVQRGQENAGLVNSDLLPQYAGPELFVPARRPAGSLLFFLVIIYPALIVLLRLIMAGRRKFEGNELLVRQKRAYELFARRLAAVTAADSAPAAEIFSALRIYLGDKLGFAGESATAGELVKLPELVRLSEPLRLELTGMLRELERTQYGGSDLGLNLLEEAKAKAAALVKQVEHEVQG